MSISTISKEYLRDLVAAADDEALEEGAAPNQRSLRVVSKVMKKLGYVGYVLFGSGADPMVADQFGRALSNGLVRDEQCSGMPEDRKWLPRIVCRVTHPGRRIDDQFACRQPGGERLHIGLDATGAGRKVVGDQQRSPHEWSTEPFRAQVAANDRSPVRIRP